MNLFHIFVHPLSKVYLFFLIMVPLEPAREALSTTVQEVQVVSLSKASNKITKIIFYHS